MIRTDMNHHPYPYAVMKEKPDALERLELQFKWGRYGLRVLRWHLTTFEPGLVIRFHKHSEFEFHFVPRGKGTVTLIDTAYKLESGMFYLTGPGVVHRQTSEAKTGMDELCLHIDIQRLEDGPAGSGWGEDWEVRESESCVHVLKHFPLRPFLDRHDAMSCFLAAYEAFRSGDIGAYTTIRQSVIQILIRAAKAAGGPDVQQPLPERDIQAHRLRMALQYIRDNYANPITLQEVADRIQISGRQLQRLLVKHGIVSFSSYLEDFRLQRICEDLTATADTVEAIAGRHGFANSNYLYRVFKRKIGVTPLAYRAGQSGAALRSSGGRTS
ncbi:helix-turn-helix domain-containing protein [Paenibacillus thailandensis]|uniref:Helix-turn-helix domain-containing protein n=1 Tax=Paenibacillus thailandensis TaxID=393250 RepID=A0ABW5QYP8_9BACL